MCEQIDLRAFLIRFQRIIDDWLDRGGGEVGVRHGIGGKVVVRDEKMMVEKIPETCLVSMAGFVRSGPGNTRLAVVQYSQWHNPAFHSCNCNPFFSIILSSLHQSHVTMSP